MEQEEKQLALWEWHQRYLEHYKGLRFQLPVLIITVQLGVFAFITKDLEASGGYARLLGSALLVLITGIGVVALWLVQRQYLDITKDMDHLQEALGMNGLPFYGTGRDTGSNQMQRTPEIFLFGYITMFLVGLALVLAQAIAPEAQPCPDAVGAALHGIMEIIWTA